MKQNTNRELCPVDNVDGIYCDAIVRKGEYAVFASLWGRSTAMMSLYGNITTGAISSLTVAGKHYGVSKNMAKLQTRLPKHSRYGSDVAHVFVYGPSVLEEVVGQRVLLQRVDDAWIWDNLAGMSHLYLPEHWRPVLLPALREAGHIVTLEAHGIDAVMIDLSAQKAYEELVCSLIRSGELFATAEDMQGEVRHENAA